MVHRVLDADDGPKSSLGDRRLAGSFGEVEDVCPDFGGEAKQTHHLRNPGAGDPLSPGDLRLAPDLARVELPTPLLGLAKKLHHPGRPGLPRGLGRPACPCGRVHDPVGGHTPCRGADGSVLERPFWPQGDFDGLFVELGHGDAGVAAGGDVENPEPDLWRRSPVRSRAGTFGEPVTDRGLGAPLVLAERR